MRTALLRTALATAALCLAATPLFANQCDAYGEAPELAAMVAAGTLPPVDERLPLNPLVVEPAEQIGMYGGEMVDTYGGQRIGEMRHYGYEPLVRWAVDGSDVVPNVAESWDISEDASTYTFKLREGMKWSDGMPFTSADILFWWERIETNTAINASGPRGHLRRRRRARHGGSDRRLHDPLLMVQAQRRLPAGPGLPLRPASRSVRQAPRRAVRPRKQPRRRRQDDG